MTTARSIRCLGVYLVVVGIVVSTFTINGVTSQHSCDDDVQALKEKCSDYVLKTRPRIAPSKACCEHIKTTDLDCVCRKISHGIELLVDIDKVVVVAKTCGKPLPSGVKCGTLTIP